MAVVLDSIFASLVSTLPFLLYFLSPSYPFVKDALDLYHIRRGRLDSRFWNLDRGGCRILVVVSQVRPQCHSLGKGLDDQLFGKHFGNGLAIGVSLDENLNLAVLLLALHKKANPAVDAGLDVGFLAQKSEF